jgi:hypothetical protein
VIYILDFENSEKRIWMGSGEWAGPAVALMRAIYCRCCSCGAALFVRISLHLCVRLDSCSLGIVLA